MSILIKGGVLVNVSDSNKQDLLIENGKITKVATDIPSSAAKQVVEADGCYVMPGGIDPHTHMQLPFMGTVASDDFFTGTRAALAGGTTMLVDFVIPNPQQSMLEALKQWQSWAEKACMDYSFHIAVTWWGDKTADEMEAIVKTHGINSFKHFMAYKNAIMVDDEIMMNSFIKARELGAICTIHAENGELVARKQQQLLKDGITGPEGHPLSRPPEVEGEAAHRAIVIADQVGVPVYIVHTSCKPALDAISKARRNGMTVIGEALIGHLLVNDEVYRNKDWDYAAAHVMSPPFRAPEHQKALWNAINNGDISVIGTDHCVFKREQKAMGKGDFTKIPNGTNGLQDRMHLLWHYGVNSGRITMNKFVELTSTNAARIFNMYPQKGSLKVGADADVVVWDPKAKRTISAKEHLQNVDFNVFEGTTVQGINRVTISNGNVVYEDGKSKAQEGAGRFIKRKPFAPIFDNLRQRVEMTQPKAVARK